MYLLWDVDIEEVKNGVVFEVVSVFLIIRI